MADTSKFELSCAIRQASGALAITSRMCQGVKLETRPQQQRVEWGSLLRDPVGGDDAGMMATAIYGEIQHDTQ